MTEEAPTSSLIRFRITRPWQLGLLCFVIGFVPPIALALGLYAATGYWEFAYLALIGNFAVPLIIRWLPPRGYFGPVRWR